MSSTPKNRSTVKPSAYFALINLPKTMSFAFMESIKPSDDIGVSGSTLSGLKN